MSLRTINVCLLLVAVFASGELMAAPAELDPPLVTPPKSHSQQLAYAYCKAVRGAKGKHCRWDYRTMQCFCPG
jgi:hypothetical protein